MFVVFRGAKDDFVFPVILTTGTRPVELKFSAIAVYVQRSTQSGAVQLSLPRPEREHHSNFANRTVIPLRILTQSGQMTRRFAYILKEITVTLTWEDPTGPVPVENRFGDYKDDTKTLPIFPFSARLKRRAEKGKMGGQGFVTGLVYKPISTGTGPVGRLSHVWPSLCKKPTVIPFQLLTSSTTFPTIH
ncbi:MAG: hypothetical protein R6U98_22230 [Pirellulaceae bacterium]